MTVPVEIILCMEKLSLKLCLAVGLLENWLYEEPQPNNFET